MRLSPHLVLSRVDLLLFNPKGWKGIPDTMLTELLDLGFPDWVGRLRIKQSSSSSSSHSIVRVSFGLSLNLKMRG
eukprot:3644109-Amphidinium_carterae.1